MKNKSIFTRQNQTLINLFRDAKHPDKVLCVPLDYAKQTHMALCCDGSGRILKKAFPVKNNPEGLAFLIEAVDGICRKHHIEQKHVFFGGEDCGTFSLNFIHALRGQGFVVIGVNAKDAKEQRENMQASSDELDLLGIAKLLLNRRGSTAGGEPGAERALRTLTRHRKAQVRLKTATGNRIHQIVDQLFPGFLDEKLSGIPPFSEASLYLMEDRFSPAQIAARQDKALLRQLKATGLQNAEAALAKLKAHARQVLAHPPELTGLLQTSLASEINLYRCLGTNIGQIEREAAQQLAQTPGAMLTTVRGTGIVLAAGVAAEIGPPDSQPSVRRLCSYAGIIPRSKQTGGPEKGPKTGKVSRRSNHILKDYIVQCGNHLGQHGPADLKEDHRRRGANKQHADFGMARRYLRMGMRLMKNGEAYTPPELRHGATLGELQAYYLGMWPALLEKWIKAGAVHTAFDEKNPLGQWRNRIEAIYGIELPLPKKKQPRTLGNGKRKRFNGGNARMAVLDCHAQAMARVRMPPGRSVPLLQGGTAQRYSDTAPAGRIDVSSNQSAADGPPAPGLPPTVSAAESPPKPPPKPRETGPCKNRSSAETLPPCPKQNSKNGVD